MRLPLRRQGREAFSLVELAVTLAVVAVLSALLVFGFSSVRSPQIDAVAKGSLITFSRVQEDAFRRGVAPASASAVTTGSFDRGDVAFTAASSEDASTVSVAVTGSAVAGAVRAGDDCWGLRLDMNPSAGSPREWWFVAIAPSSCEGSLFLAVTFPADGTGSSPGSPTII